MSENRVIGRGLEIPWHLPEDYQWFKRTTLGQVVVMGRRTFESIGRPLPHRETIIVSRSGFTHPGVRTVAALSDIDVSTYSTDVFIAGGAEIYAAALPYCTDLYLTHIKRVVDGDIFFPAFEDQFIAAATLRDVPDFQIVHYRHV